MTEKSVKLGTLIVVIAFSALVISGTGVGIWIGVRNTSHPNLEWSFKISGNIVGDDFNITMSELLDMPALTQEYTIRAKTNVTNFYTGVQLTHLFTNIIDIAPTAENVTFIAWDGYAWSFSISEFLNDETYILSYAIDGEFFDSYLEDDIGYLYLIVHSTEDFPWNGQRSIKSVVEINFE